MSVETRTKRVAGQVLGRVCGCAVSALCYVVLPQPLKFCAMLPPTRTASPRREKRIIGDGIDRRSYLRMDEAGPFQLTTSVFQWPCFHDFGFLGQ